MEVKVEGEKKVVCRLRLARSHRQMLLLRLGTVGTDTYWPGSGGCLSGLSGC